VYSALWLLHGASCSVDCADLSLIGPGIQFIVVIHWFGTLYPTPCTYQETHSSMQYAFSALCDALSALLYALSSLRPALSAMHSAPYTRKKHYEPRTTHYAPRAMHSALSLGSFPNPDRGHS
jgi:hypothetical protein